MTPRDFLGPDDRAVEKSKPYCLPFDFNPPCLTDCIPASAIGVILKRCYKHDLPQVGWRVAHSGHWWEVIAIEQTIATKNSRDQDRLPVRICRYLEPIEG